MIADPGFVHLHLHTAYSLREGALTAEPIHLVEADGQPALAVPPTRRIGSAPGSSEKATEAGVQAISGVQLAVDFGGGDDRLQLGPRQPRPARQERAGLPQSDAALLARLSRRAGGAPRIPLGDLAGLNADLIVLTGGPNGAVDPLIVAGRAEAARERLQLLLEIFGERLYVELQRHGLPQEGAVERRLLDFAYGMGLPIVAANEPYFAGAADFEAHDALLCIAEGTVASAPERRRVTQTHYFKTRAEMAALFADLPEALATSVEIARRCAFRPRTRKPIMPRFVGAEAGQDAAALDAIEAQELRRQAQEGLEARLAATGPAQGLSRQDYAERLDFELGVIEKMRFPGYFLIVSDFIKFAKSKGVPVGPGRGSGAGSLVAYALTITDLDPLRFGLFFERFLNPERVSMPDFDIDFCQTRRGEVIDYVRARYGADRVAQIITFGSFLARGVLRGVGRVLEMPLGHVDKLAKLVPQNPAKPVTLKEAVASEQKLREAIAEDGRVARLFDIAGALEGTLFQRLNACGRHRHRGSAAGSGHAALSRSEIGDAGHPVQHEMGRAGGPHQIRLSGPQDPFCAVRCRLNLVRRRAPDFDLAAVPLDDAPTYQMLGRGETIGIFQLESAGMRKALVEMHADRFEDIIALVALYRPGPMANIPTYCAVKLGDEEPDYLHPRLEPTLKETFGVIIYQEQVMQIAQLLSGYSLGEADNLRRAMGKKIKAEMDKQRDQLSAAPRNGAWSAPRPMKFSICWRNSPITASIRATPPLTRSSPTRPPGSRRIIPWSFSPRR